MNAGLVQSLHGRLGTVAPGERTPFRLSISSGQIPDVNTPRVMGVTYAPASDSQPAPMTITTRRAYREIRSVLGTPVDWLNVVGEVRNDGPESLQDARVVATFYNEMGGVVNALVGRAFRSILPAGTTSPFRLQTASGRLEYDHLALQVTARPSRFERPSGLILEVEEPAQGMTPAVFQGQIHNESGEPAMGVAVFVALYDADGHILVVEDQMVAEAVPADASIPFMLRVENHVDGWQTYDIGVVWN
jgi:hypothetical protein